MSVSQGLVRQKEVFLPDFKLPSTSGGLLGPRTFWQRTNLILAFVHGPHCDACKRLVRALIKSHAEVRSLNGEILVVIGGEARAAERLHQEMKVPFPFLYDAGGSATRRFLESKSPLRPALFVADRFGAIWHQTSPHEEDGATDLEGALKWLEFIEMQCPECDVPDTPPADLRTQ